MQRVAQLYLFEFTYSFCIAVFSFARELITVEVAIVRRIVLRQKCCYGRIEKEEA